MTVALELGDHGALLGEMVQAFRDLCFGFGKVLSEHLFVHAAA